MQQLVAIVLWCSDSDSKDFFKKNHFLNSDETL